jgi:hypothetical protein
MAIQRLLTLDGLDKLLRAALAGCDSTIAQLQGAITTREMRLDQGKLPSSLSNEMTGILTAIENHNDDKVLDVLDLCKVTNLWFPNRVVTNDYMPFLYFWNTGAKTRMCAYTTNGSSPLSLDSTVVFAGFAASDVIRLEDTDVNELAIVSSIAAGYVELTVEAAFVPVTAVSVATAEIRTKMSVSRTGDYT